MISGKHPAASDAERLDSAEFVLTLGKHGMHFEEVSIGWERRSHNCAFTQSPCGRPSWTLRLIRRRRAKGGVTVVSGA